MTSYRVITKRIVSPDGKVISEARSIAKSVGNQTEISQNVSVDISSASSSSYSSSSSSLGSSSSSSSSSISSSSSVKRKNEST